MSTNDNIPNAVQGVALPLLVEELRSKSIAYKGKAIHISEVSPKTDEFLPFLIVRIEDIRPRLEGTPGMRKIGKTFQCCDARLRLVIADSDNEAVSSLTYSLQEILGQLSPGLLQKGIAIELGSIRSCDIGTINYNNPPKPAKRILRQEVSADCILGWTMSAASGGALPGQSICLICPYEGEETDAAVNPATTVDASYSKLACPKCKEPLVLPLCDNCGNERLIWTWQSQTSFICRRCDSRTGSFRHRCGCFVNTSQWEEENRKDQARQGALIVAVLSGAVLVVSLFLAEWARSSVSGANAATPVFLVVAAFALLFLIISGKEALL